MKFVAKNGKNMFHDNRTIHLIFRLCSDLDQGSFVTYINDNDVLLLYCMDMIKILQEGQYSLIETKGQTKVLMLDGEKTFAWINAIDIGEILVTSHKKHKTDCILAVGRYRLYNVKDEPDLTDLAHLELHTGNGTWQGYLLPTGLPTDDKKRNRIIPTNEVITKSTI